VLFDDNIYNSVYSLLSMERQEFYEGINRMITDNTIRNPANVPIYLAYAGSFLASILANSSQMDREESLISSGLFLLGGLVIHMPLYEVRSIWMNKRIFMNRIMAVKSSD